MSRYLLLLLLNLPFIMAAILSALTQYKMRRISKSKFLIQTLLWIVILVGLISAEPLYIWLYSAGLTETEPLSLFDVIQITAIVIVFYMANRARAKLERLETRLQSLHQELSIENSLEKNSQRRKP